MKTSKITLLKYLLFRNISTKQTIFKNTFWLILAEGAAGLFGFLAHILIARYLGATEFGKFVFAFSFVSLFVALADFGLPTLTIREVAGNKSLAKKFIENILGLKLILGGFTFILTFLAVRLLDKSPETNVLVYLAAFFVIINSFRGFLQAIFRAFEKMEYIPLFELSFILSFSAFFLTAIYQKLGTNLLITCYILAAIITFIFVFIAVRKLLTKFSLQFDFEFWGKSLSEAWPFGMSMLLGSAYIHLSTLQISMIAGDIETALFNVAYQFILILTILSNLFFNAVFPTLSRQFRESKLVFFADLSYLTKKTILFFLFIYITLSIFANKLIFLLFGETYLASSNILKILLLGSFIMLFGSFYAEALKIVGWQKKFLRSFFIGVTIGFLLNFPLIKYYGGRGAAATLSTSSLIITSLFFLEFKKFKKVTLEET